MNRNNIPFRLISKILSKCRDIDSKIFLALSDLQIVRDIKDGNDENNDNNNYKENSPPARRSASITSLVPCEKKRANIGRIN
jgi:hypothetical protein